MSNDLEVIESLKKEGIELEELEEIDYWSKEEGYILKENVVIELKIFDKIITEKILNILSNLTNLENLDLRSNDITIIPNSLSKLTNLKWLVLYYNEIITIPDSLSKLINLKYLNLGSNQIKSKLYLIVFLSLLI